MKGIIPSLWFDENLEEAFEFYASIFPDARFEQKIKNINVTPGPDVEVLAATFQLAGHRFEAINGGPAFTFTEAVSFVVRCDDQREVDYYWDRLLDGGEAMQCGWLKDRFGLSWQIVPDRFYELMGDPNSVKANAVATAMLTMVKLDLATLEEAYRSA